LDIRIKLDDWATIRKKLEQGRIDMITGMYRTPQREKQLHFSVPFYTANYALFFRQDEESLALNEIEGGPILVQRSDLGHDWLLENAITTNLILSSTWPDALTSLSEGNTRAALGPRLQGLLVIQNRKLNNLRYTAESLFQAKYGFAVSLDNLPLLAHLNEGLAALKASGEYDRLYDRWFGIYEDKNLSSLRILKGLGWIVASLVVALSLLFLWTITLRRQVAAKTALIEKELHERSTADIALRKSEKRLAITLASIGDGVITTDLKGRVDLLNPIAEKLTGWKADEAAGKPFNEVFVLLDATTLQPVPIQLPDMPSREPALGSLLMSRDGIKRQIGDSCMTITDEAGAPHGYVLVFRDLTEPLRLEAQLHQVRRMESLGQLAGGIAHEFNNMLGGILGAAELLETTTERQTRSYRYVELILNTTRKASDLTAKLLAFAHKGRKASKPFEIHATINDCAGILASSLDKRIIIELALEAEFSIINGDPSQIQNMLITIGVHAEKAMPEGGSITISTRNVVLDELFCRKSPFALIPGEYINLHIRDTGKGFLPHQLEHLFEPFHPATPNEPQDSFGLAAVYATVVDHRGAITVYSDPDEGTAFNICIPLTSEPITEENPNDDLLVEGTGGILVVDDEESIREIAEYFLAKSGYHVIHAVNGADAVVKYRQHQENINLVLLDMTMPVMNGRDCFVALRELNPDVKVIMASGFTGQNDVRPLLKQGLAAFIEKPYRHATLSRVIHEVLNQPADEPPK
ncbi:MAG: transporter substrate-binding domain-containing protein, partial [Kiritimatiellae bacterium]|nr:transporter substrate-binding domain-containing protein [Kiritimatiellia bacterium]